MLTAEGLKDSIAQAFAAGVSRYVLKPFNYDTIRKEIDCIASHGHTVFHQPERGITVQIGSPAHIKAVTGLPVISDFRSLDVALGGQGAPLVPAGDLLLFGEYDYCLNLGGIANISFTSAENERLAFDVTFCNMVLNYLAARKGMAYDEGGQMAGSGSLIKELQAALMEWSYYDQKGPRSLGFEQVSADIFPLLQYEGVSDVLHTCVLHVAHKIAECCKTPGRMLITGGGAHNTFLHEQIQHALSGVEVVYPEPWLVDYKEAIVFSLLGALRVWGKENVLSSVTGASADSVSGQYL